jgi:alpha-L-rhamnosidase
MVQIPWYIYMYYGDVSILNEFYSDMKNWVQYVHAKNVNGIIPHGLGDWCPPGGNKNIDCPVPVSSTAFHILDVSIMKQVARKLGFQEDYKYYSYMLDTLINRFNSSFFDKENHTYGSQTADAMALDIGIVPFEEKEKVAEAMVKNINEKFNGFINTGIFGLGRIFKVLCENGQEEEVYRLLNKKDNNSFAMMWEHYDATTLWEVLPVDINYDQTHLYERSHSHPMQAGYDAWFYSGIAGINPTPQSPGFEKIIFKPYLTRFLTKADASYESGFGTIMSAWRSSGDTFKWYITIPENSVGEIYVPVNKKSCDIKVNGENIDNAGIKSGFIFIGQYASGDYVIEVNNKSFTDVLNKIIE